MLGPCDFHPVSRPLTNVSHCHAGLWRGGEVQRTALPSGLPPALWPEPPLLPRHAAARLAGRLLSVLRPAQRCGAQKGPRLSRGKDVSYLHRSNVRGRQDCFEK